MAITGIGMPVADGSETARRMTTDAGFNHHLVKPEALATLREMAFLVSKS